ncbi:PREDICTED: threonylcarbamoyladenosine tRNA methylthiotransferase, partial [Phaethon lepturus]|uniref:threonylcarbamoyladenosine tRNA methylthiotransferase n=1 Tax=Phaethon lepturus TaxID=97097 RepID=UPI00053061F7
MPAACDSVLEDIEDIVSAEDLKPHDRQFIRKNVFPKVRKRISQKNQTDDDPPSDSIIPGAQKIWIRTWGCSHNNSDGEYMAGQLAAYGYKITDLFNVLNRLDIMYLQQVVDHAKLEEVADRLETSAVVQRDLKRLEKVLAET